MFFFLKNIYNTTPIINIDKTIIIIIKAIYLTEISYFDYYWCYKFYLSVIFVSGWWIVLLTGESSSSIILFSSIIVIAYCSNLSPSGFLGAIPIYRKSTTLLS